MVQHVDAQFQGWSTLFQEPNGWLIWRGATSSNLLNCLGPMVVSCASFVVVGSWFRWVSQITNLLRRLWPLSRTPIFPHELLQRLFGMENPWAWQPRKVVQKWNHHYILLVHIGTVKSVHLNISVAFRTFLDVSIAILEFLVDLVAPSAVASAASFSVRTVAPSGMAGIISLNRSEQTWTWTNYIVKMYKELKVIDHWYYYMYILQYLYT